MGLGVTEWKREGDTIALGNLDNPTWDGVNAPSNVVKSASEILGGEPSEWRVENTVDRGKQIVCLTGKQHRHLVYLVLPDKWVLLNHPKGLTHINSVLEGFTKSPCELLDPITVATYFEEVAYLFKGPQRVALSKLFLRDAEQPFESSGEPEQPLRGWLNGKEKNPEALRSLCADPIITLQGDSFEMQCNIITSRGSIEKWALKGKLGKSITITNILVTEIREEGTFSFGLIGEQPGSHL